MSHPLLFLSTCCCINGKWLCCCSDQPSIACVWNGFYTQYWYWSFLKRFDNSRGVSSSPCSWTSSSGMMCCLLYFFLPMIMLPYTRMSLKRKNCRGFGRLRHIFVRTPSPTSTRPGMSNCSPELPKQLSTICIRRAFASLFTASSFDTWEKCWTKHHRDECSLGLSTSRRLINI